MSSKKRRNLIKNKLKALPSATIEELQNEGKLPKRIELYDNVDYKVYLKSKSTNWWKKMK